MKKEFDDMTLKEKLTAGICTEMEGKMEGMWSMSTSCISNPLCQRNQKIEGSICQHCYAKTLQEMRKALDAKGCRNAELLTKEILADEDLPDINPEDTKWFRFEAFGDIHNITHLTNYVNIAKHNPGVRFTLWTKNYFDALTYFKLNKCPDNMNLMISSMFVNQPANITAFEATGNFAPNQVKVFTVYDYEFLKEHPEVIPNCGSRYCKGCKICYTKNEVKFVNEILKSDQARAEKMIMMRDPVKRKAYIDKLFDSFKIGGK